MLLKSGHPSVAVSLRAARTLLKSLSKKSNVNTIHTNVSRHSGAWVFKKKLKFEEEKNWLLKCGLRFCFADSEAQTSNSNKFLTPHVTVSFLQPFIVVLTTRLSVVGKHLYIWSKVFNCLLHTNMVKDYEI